MTGDQHRLEVVRPGPSWWPGHTAQLGEAVVRGVVVVYVVVAGPGGTINRI